jgi:outer membrane immunogenic protein
MSKSKLIIAMVAIVSMSSMAMAGGYELSGKGFAPPPVYSWTGFYVGGHAGLATGNTEAQVPGFDGLADTDFSMDGGIYGGHVGYNYQAGAWVFGIEGTYAGSNVEGNGPSFVVLNVQRELDWLATVEGRLGYAFGRSMIYARGGWAWAKLDTGVSIAGFNIFSGDATHNGWTAGFGFEHALGDWLIGRVEYAHVDLDTENHALAFTGDGCCLTDNVEGEIDTIRIGASIKFGGHK